MTLNSDDLTANFVAPDGTKTACTYTLDEKVSIHSVLKFLLCSL